MKKHDYVKDKENEKGKEGKLKGVKAKYLWLILGAAALYIWRRTTASDEMNEKESGLSGFDDYF